VPHTRLDCHRSLDINAGQVIGYALGIELPGLIQSHNDGVIDSAIIVFAGWFYCELADSGVETPFSMLTYSVCCKPANV